MDRAETEDRLFGDASTHIASEAPTLVDLEEDDMELEAIPAGMTPYDLLKTLTEETRLIIYCQRYEERSPKWTP
jgi:hypothetical protein